MGVPKDVDARKFYRVSKQRLEDAELNLVRIDRPAAAIYLSGYSVECILKALLLVLYPAGERQDALRSLKDDFGHNLRRLRAGVISRGVNIPREVARELLFVSSWSPELRYEPGPGDRKEAERFVAAAKSIIRWAD